MVASAWRSWPGADVPDASDRPSWRKDLRLGRSGRRDRNALDGKAGLASAALMLRMERNAERCLNVEGRAVEGLTPKLSRAEGVGLND